MATVPELDFDEEVEKFQNGLPFDITVICDELGEARTKYIATIGHGDGVLNWQNLIDKLTKGLPAICRYVSDNEKNKAFVVAAYSDANKRKIAADNDAAFWKGGMSMLAFMVMFYLAIRSYMWLGPHVREIWTTICQYVT